MKNVKPYEKLSVFCVFIIFVVLSGAPLLYDYITQPAGFGFSWLGFYAQGDNLVYYSYINQIRDGSWTLKNLFTSEAGGEMFNLAWLIIGLPGRILPALPTEIIFHASKYIFVLPYIFLVYRFLGFFFNSPRKKYLCLILLFFSSGFGGLAALFYQPVVQRTGTFDTGAEINWPIDLWVSEMHNWSAIAHSPHFVLSLLGVAAIFYFFLLGYLKFSTRWIVAAALTALTLFQFHPYHAPIIYSVIACFLIFEVFNKKIYLKKAFYIFFLLLLVSLPSLIYHLIKLGADPTLALRALQNINQLPKNLLFILAGYGFLLPAGLVGLWGFWKKRDRPQNRLIIVWFVVNFLAIFIPWKFQSRATQTLSLPLIILALEGILTLFRSWPKLYKFLSQNFAFAGFLYLLIFSFTPLYTASSLTLAYRDPNLSRIFYLSSEYLDAFSYIKNYLPKDSVFLVAPTWRATFLPAYAVRRVFVGHGDETINFDQKIREAENFWRQSASEQTAFLKKSGISHIFIDDGRKFSDLKINPGAFQIVYKNKLIKIVEVGY